MRDCNRSIVPTRYREVTVVKTFALFFIDRGETMLTINLYILHRIK